MTNFYLDTRELRSFRFKYYAKEINNILKDKTSDAGFCVTESFYPVERQFWREQLINKELIITAIPNQMGRFLFNDSQKKWQGVRNLLKGQIFLVKSKTGTTISMDTLKKFLSFKKFYMRIFIFKDQLYRADVMQKRSLLKISKNDGMFNFIMFLSSKVINLLYLSKNLKNINIIK